MIIAQISDTHIALDAPDTGRRLADFARTIADINTLDPQPDVIVHTGDVAHNGKAEEYARAKVILEKARAPVFAIAGNKDKREIFRSAFSARGYLPASSAFIQYAVEEFPVRLLMLDTLSTHGNQGDYCAERLKHLTQMLEHDTARPVAVFAHHPPFPVPEGPRPLHYENEITSRMLASALSKYGNVAAVFCGHVHRSITGNVEGIPAYIVPSVATSLRYGPYPARMEDRPVYQIHRFDSRWGFGTETRIVQDE